MTEDLRNAPEWREFEATVERTLAEHRRESVKPWRQMLFWLTVAYVVLLAASIVQWVTP